MLKTDPTPLQGWRILIWPDADSGGLEFAQKAAGTLKAIGAERIRIARIEDDGSGRDAADIADVQERRETLKDHIRHSEIYAGPALERERPRDRESAAQAPLPQAGAGAAINRLMEAYFWAFCQGKFGWDRAMGLLRQYTGTHWATVDISELIAEWNDEPFRLYMLEHANPALAEDVEIIRLTDSQSWNAASSLARMKALMPRRLGRAWPHMPRHEVNFQDGVINIKTGTRRDRTGKDAFLYCLPFNRPQPWAALMGADRHDDQALKAHMVRKTVLNASNGDDRIGRWLQCAVGAIAAGLVTRTILWICGGPGTGKTTFVNALAKAVGDMGVQLEEKDVTTSHWAAPHNSALARALELDARFLFYPPEVDTKMKLNIGRMKSLSGWDSQGFRSPYGKRTVSGHIRGVPIVVSNYNPESISTDKAFRERLHTVVFARHFTGGDHEAIPAGELWDMMNDPAMHQAWWAWMIDGGGKVWRDYGGTLPPVPDTLAKALATFSIESDSALEILAGLDRQETYPSVFVESIIEAELGEQMTMRQLGPKLRSLGWDNPSRRYSDSKKKERRWIFTGKDAQGHPVNNTIEKHHG